MSSHLLAGAKRSAVRLPLLKVVIRHNGLLFHGIAVASLIECAAPLHINALIGAFPAECDIGDWLEQEWWAIKVRHGQQLRNYVEGLWRQFDWANAYEGFYQAYRPRGIPGYSGYNPSEIALALCATAAQAAAFYRGLACYVDDPELRELLREMATDESLGFDRFRKLFDHLNRVHPLRGLQAYRIINCSAMRARDGVVRLAFSQLAEQWYETPPFPQLQYREFILRMGELLCRLRKPGPTERLLFRPWLKIPRCYGNETAPRALSETPEGLPQPRVPLAA